MTLTPQKYTVSTHIARFLALMRHPTLRIFDNHPLSPEIAFEPQMTLAMAAQQDIQHKRPCDIRVNDLPKLQRAGRAAIEFNYFKQHVRYQLKRITRLVQRL
ncbi:hypothetical protein JX266_004885 [Neoarthrinium moseri]|nr:hypothetical protein JX266_004885 [Neoarthrinium moseri]